MRQSITLFQKMLITKLYPALANSNSVFSTTHKKAKVSAVNVKKAGLVKTVTYQHVFHHVKMGFV
jgi:hypothetical protein